MRSRAGRRWLDDELLRWGLYRIPKPRMPNPRIPKPLMPNPRMPKPLPEVVCMGRTLTEAIGRTVVNRW